MRIKIQVILFLFFQCFGLQGQTTDCPESGTIYSDVNDELINTLTELAKENEKLYSSIFSNKERVDSVSVHVLKSRHYYNKLSVYLSGISSALSSVSDSLFKIKAPCAQRQAAVRKLFFTDSLAKAMQDTVNMVGNVYKQIAVRWRIVSQYVIEAKNQADSLSWAEYYLGSASANMIQLFIKRLEIANLRAFNELLYNINSSLNSAAKEAESRAFFISTKTQRVTSGDPYQYDIVMAKYDTTQQFEVSLHGKWYKAHKGSFRCMEQTAGEGPRIIEGEIRYYHNKKLVREPYELTYKVFEDAAAISPDAQNILYVGIENPLSISVPGYSSERIIADYKGKGTLQHKGRNKYVAVPDSAANAIISVSVKKDDGSLKKMGEKYFKVMELPQPVAEIGTLVNGGVFICDSIKANATIIKASIKNTAFTELPIKITGYTLSVLDENNKIKTVGCTGERFSKEALELINSAWPGDRVIIENIHCTIGTSQNPVELMPVLLKVK